MEIGVTVRNMGAQSDPDTVLACVEAAEERGFESAWVVDHLAIPPDDAEGAARTVEVEYVVAVSGAVTDARVIESSEESPKIRAFPQGYFAGFLELNAVPTVRRWKYLPIERPCTARATFTYEQADDA